MTRFVASLVLSLSCLSVVSASLSERRQAHATGPVPLAKQLIKANAALKPLSNDFQVVDTTEVLLNGKPCSYSDVPANASIVTLEVSADRRTILKIHFRTE